MLLGLRRRLRATFRAAGLGRKRSAAWPALERSFLEKNKECAACGSATRLQVHHKLPFHLHPELELAEGNLVALCMGRNACHLLIGHGDDFRAYTPGIEELLAGLRAKLLKLPAARARAFAERVYR